MLKPFLSILPEVSKPERKVCSRIMQLAIVLIFVFLLPPSCCHFYSLDSIQGKGSMDSHHIVYLPCLLSSELLHELAVGHSTKINHRYFM